MTNNNSSNILDIIDVESNNNAIVPANTVTNTPKPSDHIIGQNRPLWEGVGKHVNLSGIDNNDPKIIESVLKQTDLNWTVAKNQAFMPSPSIIDENGYPQMIVKPGEYDIFRLADEDNKIEIPLATVGSKYEIYQNHEMISFANSVREMTNGTFTVGGQLRGGKISFVMVKLGENEIIGGDNLENYVLFVNSHGGATPVKAIFLHHRLACYNALMATLAKSKNFFKISHTANMVGRLKRVEKLMATQIQYHDNFVEVMKRAAQFQLPFSKMQDIIEQIVFPLKKRGEEAPTHAETIRKKNIELTYELLESGAGTDIPGVKGTLWHLYNTLTEKADHHGRSKKSKDLTNEEIRFETGFLRPSSLNKKQQAMDIVIDVMVGKI